uniref:RNase III domain-containing protein n=1 Tax=viral metagenome TaxID=1070528 RepID=A0A6C0BEK2_9ZZZZ
MESLNKEIVDWVTSFEEQLDVILISFDQNLIESLVQILVTIKNCGRIVLSNKFLDNIRNGKKGGVSDIEVKNPNRIISTIDFGSNPSYCLFFGDFNGTNRLTISSVDYYEKVDREPTYRKYCRSVMMFRLVGIPPANGYWHTNGLVEPNSQIVILKLSEWGQMCQGIPFTNKLGSTRINIGNVEISKQWIDALKIHLRYLITSIAGRNTYTEDMLNDENMIVWVKVFLHPTYGYIYNYEGLEFFGDSISGAKFDSYMIAKYPRLTQTELSEYHNQYMSKDNQWYISDDLRLKDYILIDPIVSVSGANDKKRKTDLLESFVGALYQVSLSAVSNVTGSSKKGMFFAEEMTYNLFIMIGEQFPFEKKMIFGKPKHRITQILQSMEYPLNGVDLKMGFIEVDKATENARNKFFFRTSDKIVNFLKQIKEQNGKDITSFLDVEHSFIPQFVSRESAESEFWNKVAKVFDDNGVDITFVKNIKATFITMLRLIDIDLHDRIMAKLSLTYPGKKVEDLASRIQFKSDHEEGSVAYIIMYINTFEAEPDSKLLISFSNYNGISQKAADDYITELDTTVQITNLSVVPMPLESGNVGTYSLNTFELGRYRCCERYANT